MNFQNLNRLNALANVVSGNFLPMTNINEKLSTILKIYFVVAWIIELIYVAASFLGLFNVSGEKALKDGTVNIAISFEVIVFNIYLHSRKKLLHKLIGKLNHLLITEDEIFRSVITDTVKPLEMPLKIYVIASVASLMIWILSPLIKLFQKDEFYYEDFIMPAVFSKQQPFSNDVFICGIFLQLLGGEDTIIRKISLDIYTIYLCLLITAQYKYLRIKFAIILKEEREITKDHYKNIIWRNDNVRQEMKLVTRHNQVS